ncbi:MAG: DUF6036 family nucleotidyltransferase [Thermoleophilaceae bacterium]
MNNIAPDITRERGERLLAALAEQLAAKGYRYEIVVVGGAGLQALGIIDRVTRDIDIVALREGDDLVDAERLPAEFIEARDRVAADFRIPTSWLNSEPASLRQGGLPAGFVDRLETRSYGTGLIVHLASRTDQIFLKLYAAVDQGPGKHEADLRMLSPTSEELVAAARWARTHDPSSGFAQVLRECLAHFGVADVELGA